MEAHRVEIGKSLRIQLRVCSQTTIDFTLTLAQRHLPKANRLPLLQEEREPADDILAYVRLISDRLLREEADISLQLTLLSSIE